MIRHLTAVCLAASVLSTNPVAAETADNPKMPPELERCRTAFDDGGSELTKGILFDGELLCVYGTITASNAQAIVERNQSLRISTIVVQSYGGDVASWLLAAESFSDGIDLLVVDGFCFSSCANYFAPLAKRILAVPGSLMVWHGGPNRWDDAEKYGAVTDQDRQNYAELSQRTEAFFKRHGISPGILRVSGQPLSAWSSRQLALMGLSERTLAGYAFSPERLTDCFGFSSVNDLWHPGGNIKVMRLSKDISERFAVAETPKQFFSCDFPPDDEF